MNYKNLILLRASSSSFDKFWITPLNKVDAWGSRDYKFFSPLGEHGPRVLVNHPELSPLKEKHTQGKQTYWGDVINDLVKQGWIRGIFHGGTMLLDAQSLSRLKSGLDALPVLNIDTMIVHTLQDGTREFNIGPEENLVEAIEKAFERAVA